MSDHTPAPAPPALPTPELIAKLRRLANAATPGPWAPDSVMSEAVNEIILDYPTPEAGCPVIVASTYDDEFRSPTAGKGEANCRFLSACDPQTVLSLVAAAERLAKAERDVTFLADKVIPKLEDRLRDDLKQMALGIREHLRLEARVNELTELFYSVKAERDKLAAFKSYVHKRLDAAGVPADPESPHKEHGCRIGGRLDIVLADRDLLREVAANLDEMDRGVHGARARWIAVRSAIRAAVLPKEARRAD